MSLRLRLVLYSHAAAQTEIAEMEIEATRPAFSGARRLFLRIPEGRHPPASQMYPSQMSPIARKSPMQVIP